MRKNTILAFAGGAVIGLIGGIIITDLYYKKAIEEVVYEEKANDYMAEEEEVDGMPTAKKNKQYEKKRPEDTVAYHKMYKKQYEEDELDLSDDGEEEPVIDEEAVQYHEEHKDKAPKVISLDEIDDTDIVPKWFDTQTILYYQYDDTLINETDDTVILTEEEEALFGNCLLDSGFNDNDDEYIYIINYALDVLYRIEKQFAAYAAEISQDEME